MELKYHPEVRVEVLDAVRFYEQRQEGLGKRLLHVLRASVDRIVQQPHVWPLVGHRVRRFIVSGFPYQVLYAVVSDKLWIVAVAHHKRRPGYWRHRMDDLPDEKPPVD